MASGLRSALGPSSTIDPRNFLTFRNHVYARHSLDVGEHRGKTDTAQDGDSDSQTFPVITNEESFDNEPTDDETESDQVDGASEVDYVSAIQKAAATWILKVYKCIVITNLSIIIEAGQLGVAFVPITAHQVFMANI